MKQFNINITPEFRKDLKLLMKHRGIKEKAQAIRMAVKEVVERILSDSKQSDFRGWLGMGLKSPQNSNPRFNNEDDLWS
jgi:hypothetical protein